MKKKLVMAVLSIAMVASLVGCNMINDVAQAVLVDSGSEEVSEYNNATEEYSEEDGESVVQALAPETIKFKINHFYDYCYDEERQTSLARISYDVLEVDPDSNHVLADKINQIFMNVQADNKSYFEEMISMAKEGFDSDWFPGEFYSDERISVLRADSAVFCYTSSYDDYLGGAHGSYGLSGNVFDSQTGKELTWKDFFTCSEQEMTDLLIKKIETEYSDSLDGFFEYKEIIGKEVSGYVETYEWSDEPYYYSVNIYAGMDGVTFVFNPYEIACFAAGMQFVTFPYDEYADIMNPKYSVRPEEYAMSFYGDSYEPFVFDIDNDGAKERVEINLNYDEYQNGTSYDFIIDGNKTSFEGYTFSIDPTFVKTVNGNFILLQMSVENDYKFVKVYRVEANKTVKEIGSFPGYIGSMVNPNCFMVTQRQDLLSTYETTMYYKFNSDGTLSQLDELFEIAADISIVSTVPLDVFAIDTEGWVAGDRVTVPAGSSFKLMYTNGKDIVDCFVDGYGYVRIKLGAPLAGDWVESINGVSATDCFEMLYFAG